MRSRPLLGLRLARRKKEMREDKRMVNMLTVVPVVEVAVGALHLRSSVCSTIRYWRFELSER